MTAIAEKVRPSTWSDVVGQDKAVGKLQRLAQNGNLAGRALWFSGSSGTGKTTLALLAAHEVADDWSIEEWDGQSLTVADLLAIEKVWHIRGMGKGGRAYLVNESHGLRKPVIRQLLVMLERIPAHCLVCFTTTSEGQDSLFEDCDDANPLLSRCLRIDLSRRDLLAPFTARCQSLFPAMPREKIERILRDNRNNLRAALMACESWEMDQD